MGNGSAPGHPCVICGHTPAFCFTGEALCSKHLPWNEQAALKIEEKANDERQHRMDLPRV